jgi:hypothetical protein
VGLQALQSGKLDANKVANNDLTTEAGYAWDARRGKVIRDDLIITNNILNASLMFNMPTVSIPVSSNLNNYVTPGLFKTESGAVSATIVNTPYTGSGFKFIVEKLSSDVHIMQTIKAVNSPYMYYRTAVYSGTEWTFNSWQTDNQVKQTAVTTAIADINIYNLIKYNPHEVMLNLDIMFNTTVTATNTWYPLFNIPDSCLPPKAVYFTIFMGANILQGIISVTNKNCQVRLTANISIGTYMTGTIKYDK